jgi:hypothetical protein
MGQLTNTNFRGIRISPAGLSGTIHYYVCVIDQPISSNFDPTKVSVVQPAQGDTTLKFIYEGSQPLQECNDGDALWTFVLPVYTYQEIARGVELSAIITDKTPDANYAKGNPNYGRPPVIQPVDGNHHLTPTFVFLKCQTGEANPQTLIMGAIVNTNFYLGDGTLSNGGYANSFVINPDSQNGEYNAPLSVSEGTEHLAAYGIISWQGTWQYYSTIKISAGGQTSTTPVPIPDSWHSF